MNVLTLDEECIRLAEIVEHGFLVSTEELPKGIRQYWSMKDNLYTIEGVTFRDHRMLIPKQPRNQVVQFLAEENQGIMVMKENARFYSAYSASD